jgi:hypothetical protein
MLGMAVIGLTTGNTEVTLSPRTLVGRSNPCTVRITDRRVSNEHAALSWNGLHWQLRDLASFNGTLLNDRPLAPGTIVKVSLGDVIQFGCAEVSWMLLDDGPPIAFARRVVDSRTVSATHGWLLLPSADDPRVCVARIDSSAWQLEVNGERQEVRDQELIDVDGERWRLYLPSAENADETDTSNPRFFLSGLKLVFYVSPDEEHVEIRLRAERRDVSLAPRAHHYLLLTLARARAKDASLAESERGWVHVETLAQWLRIDVEKLNVDIFRARRQFLDAGVSDAHGLIQRRQHSRSLRLGSERFEIRRGDQTTCPEVVR